MDKKITFCGNILVDSVKTIASWPDKGMLVQITDVKRAVGGSVCNSGVDMKTLDPSLAVQALGMVGADDAGDFAFAEQCASKTRQGCSLMLQAEWDSREAAYPLIFNYVLKNPAWRISIQTHKILNIR